MANDDVDPYTGLDLPERGKDWPWQCPRDPLHWLAWARSLCWINPWLSVDQECDALDEIERLWMQLGEIKPYWADRPERTVHARS